MPRRKHRCFDVVASCASLVSVRRIAVAAVVGISLVVARVAAPSHASHFRYSAALACGVERWKVRPCRTVRACSVSTRSRSRSWSPTSDQRQCRDKASLRASYLQRRCLRDARQARGGRGFSPRPRVWRQRHDRGVALVGVCAQGDAVSAPADARSMHEVAALLASARRRRRVLRFQAWPDGRRPERSRAASDPRLCLLVELDRPRTHAQVQAQRSRMGRRRLSPAFSHEQPPLGHVAFRTSAPRIERARTKRRR